MNKRSIFIALFLLVISFQNMFAQSHKNSFVIMCDKMEDGNIINTFSGFNGNAVGKEEEFATVIYFRGLIGTPHKGQLVIEKPNGEVRKSKTFSFILDDKVSQHRHTINWGDVYFPIKGIYAIKVYIDDRLDSTLYFRVGN